MDTPDCVTDCSTCVLAAAHGDDGAVALPAKQFNLRLRKRPKVVLSNWLVVKTKPNHERYAAKNVKRQGHKTFVPFLRDERGRESPLFPGIIFVEGPEWYYLKSTYGALGPVMMGQLPGYVPIREMKSLLKMAGEDDVIEPEVPKVRKGMMVKFTSRSFDGLFAKIIDLPKKDRVTLLFSILGKDVTIEVDRRDISTKL
jgi:transcription antitermination factor NusG